MKATVIAEGRGTKWICFGRDDDMPEKIVETNHFLVLTPSEAVLLEPGGTESFPALLSAVLQYCPVERIGHVFVSHQDPDVCSSISLWNDTLPHAKLYAPWLWEGFLRHFGCNRMEFVPIPDEGLTLALDQCDLRFVPAHYLHSSGNFNVYDARLRVLMSGDLGAALEPRGSPLYVDEFALHEPRMRLFHQRWLPSRRAKDDWVRRMRQLDIDLMAPQHGRMFRGPDVTRFLDWLEALEVGIGV